MTNIYEDLDLNEVWRQVMPHIFPHKNSKCKVADYSRHKHKKYCQVRFKKRKYYVHVLAAMKGTGERPQGREASHRCSVGECVNPAHLCFENGDINKSRICCFLFLNKEKNYTCPHQPTCISV
jgi:hypothetical protein